MPHISLRNNCDENVTAIASHRNFTLESNEGGSFWSEEYMDPEGEFNISIIYKDDVIQVSGIYGQGIIDYVHCIDYFGNELNCDDVDLYHSIISVVFVLILITVILLILRIKLKKK
jgi:hypothetical protein